jgi:cyclophilin family peptidyl-prolyl cis-trans isomerase
MPESRRRTRDRNLAKHAARRQMERMRAARRRRYAVWAAAVALMVAVGFVGGTVLGFIGDDDDQAGITPTSTASSPAPPTPSPSPEPGTRTGTVPPLTPEATEVGCGAEAPAAAAKPKPQFAGPPPLTIDPEKTYVATMATSCGPIVLMLDAKRAPQTVNSFVFLARKHYFDGILFHRVVASTDVIQAGNPGGTGGPGYTIPDELKGKISYTAGTLAMAKSTEPDTGGSQFFIIAGPGGTKLDKNPDYTIFGRVISGLNVAKRINAFQPKGVEDSFPTKIIYINSMRVRTVVE